MALCSDNDIIRIVDDSLGLMSLHPVNHDLGAKLGVSIAKAGKSADAVQTVGRREYLDSQPLCVLNHEPPHVNHHGVMKAGINLVDQKETSLCRKEIQDQSEEVSQASAKSPQRKSPISALEFQQDIGRRRSPPLNEKSQPLDVRLDQLQSLGDPFLLGSEHQSIPELVKATCIERLCGEEIHARIRSL